MYNSKHYKTEINLLIFMMSKFKIAVLLFRYLPYIRSMRVSFSYFVFLILAVLLQKVSIQKVLIKKGIGTKGFATKGFATKGIGNKRYWQQKVAIFIFRNFSIPLPA